MRLPRIVIAASVLALAVAADPAAGQTADTFQNQKLNDMRSHERGEIVGSEATNHYDLGVGYLQRMQALLDEENRSEREEKKLQKSYEKAVSHLEKAAEAAPEWIDPQMMLGALHYKMARYQDAKTAYESVLALDPDNESAKSYLASVEWYLARTPAAAAGEESGGGQP